MRTVPDGFSLALLLMAATISGCTSTPDPLPTDVNEASVKLGVAPALTCKPKPNYRWLDALDHPYSETFRRSYSYSRAEVVVRSAKRSEVFCGRIEARNLKPNFAYQVKLVGMPRFIWGDDAAPASNRRIGEVGRWWIPGNDARNAYSYEVGQDGMSRDRMEGYLLFDYFVTDAQGAASVPFRIDNSSHVLWRTDQSPPAPGDSEPTTHRIVAEADNYAYDRSFITDDLELYLEQEWGRPERGTARLPAGDYRCFFLLTEESFHARGEFFGGDWAAALAAPVEFTIVSGEAVNTEDATAEMADEIQ